MLKLTTENPHTPVCVALMTALSAELSARYDDDTESGTVDVSALAVPRAAVVIAWWGDAAVGCGAYLPTDDPTCAEIKRVYVQPESRGKGISRKLMAHLEAVARSDGYERLILETGVRQPEAIALYDRSGYTRIPCYPPYATNPLSVCFEKWLTPS